MTRWWAAGLVVVASVVASCPSRETTKGIFDRCSSGDIPACALGIEVAANSSDSDIVSRSNFLMKDPTVLSALAMRSDIDPRIRCWAMRGARISPTVATRLATSDSEPCAREAAVDQLEDQQMLSQIAMSDSDDKVRAAALERVADVSLHMKRVRVDKSDWVRWHAVQRISDQELLTLVARMDAGPYVRLEAIDRLQDRSLARQLAGEIAQGADEKASMVVLEAFERGRPMDQAPLVAIATGPQNYIIRGAATEQIEDPEVLARIAQSDEHQEVRAIARHQRDSVVLALQCEHGDKGACHTLEARARTTAPWVRSDDERLLWRAAIRCLRNPDALAEIARSADVREREAAVENRHLVSQAVLAEIAANEAEDVFVRDGAIRKLVDRTLLARLATSDTAFGYTARARLVAVPESGLPSPTEPPS